MDKHLQELDQEEQKVLNSVKFSRVIVPILLGLLVVAYLIYTQLDFDELQNVNWNFHLFFWTGMAIFMYVLRHLFYSWRLKLLSNDVFSWVKSIELIFIWEFSSAVSPTSIGGSAVALFFLAQEKISNAKSATIVFYTIVLDTAYSIISLLGLYLIFGAEMIRPEANLLSDLDGLGYTFFAVLFFMTAYGSVIFYGLFVNPQPIKNFLLWLSNRKLLKRFKEELLKTSNDIVISSKELSQQSVLFHIKAFLATSGAWTTRFLAINFIIAGIVGVHFDWMDHLLMLGRGEVMHVITAFSPTPGGAGIAEIIFGGFFSDYISEGLSLLAAVFWRIISYYPYLIVGVIIIPVWLRQVLNRRRKLRSKS